MHVYVLFGKMFQVDSSWLFREELKEKVTTKGWRNEIILVVILQELGNLRKSINTFLFL